MKRKRLCLIALLVLLLIAFPMFLQTMSAASEGVLMKKALPVWAKGREKEMNLTLGFRGSFKAEEGEKVTLRIAASTLYRCFVNGEFVGSGPARAAH